MTNFHVTLIDFDDCDSTCGEFVIEAVDKADAELQMLETLGTHFHVSETLPLDEL